MSNYDHLYNFGSAFQSDFYKVTNLSPEPAYMTWNKFLLNEEDREAYEAFKETPAYLGTNPRDIAARKKLPEAFKVRPFYEQLGKGVQFKATDATQVGENVIAQPRYEYRYCIGANIDFIRKEKRNALGLAKWICNKYEIPFDPLETDLETLIAPIEEKFGSNVTVMTKSQWEESGIRNKENRTTLKALKPGQKEQEVINHGYIVAEPLTDLEYKTYIETGELEPTSEALTDTNEVVKQARKEAENAQAKVDSTIEEMTIDELKKELDSRGIEYKVKSPKPVLVNLLKADSEV